MNRINRILNRFLSILFILSKNLKGLSCKISGRNQVAD